MNLFKFELTELSNNCPKLYEINTSKPSHHRPPQLKDTKRFNLKADIRHWYLDTSLSTSDGYDATLIFTGLRNGNRKKGQFRR